MSNLVYISLFVLACLVNIFQVIDYCIRLFAAPDDARATPERPTTEGNEADYVVVDVVGLQRKLVEESRRLKLQQMIPSVMVEENDSLTFKYSSDCTICLLEFETGEEVRVLPGCGHSYHSACIDEWLLDYDSKRCPTCRATTL